jgi:hypothetical protein
MELIRKVLVEVATYIKDDIKNALLLYQFLEKWLKSKANVLQDHIEMIFSL